MVQLDNASGRYRVTRKVRKDWEKEGKWEELGKNKRDKIGKHRERERATLEATFATFRRG